ncbi:MAG: ABC transporter ATP-binding protein [Thermodesulfobacteriota bacterium]|nr:ABC transporter ATP-binding protein [Thermodesulfobacteriota bacterium]
MTLCLMENVRKIYRIADLEVEVLKGIDLRIEPGEFVAVMGPSGSGKTTLMNILGCLDVATSGRYVLAGTDVSAFSDDELSMMRSEHLGFVFQSFHLLTYATALENVLLPTLYLERRRDGFRERALELLELVGLKDRADFKPTRLSGGQQQRVAIARALMNDPELILADEPTGALDSRTASEIMELLSGMHQQGKTLVVITHDRKVAGYAQRIIQIRDGTILDSGEVP